MTTSCRFGLLLIVLLVGCSRAKMPTKPVEFDDDSKAILDGATKVEVFRIDPQNGPNSSKPHQKGEKRIGGWLIAAQGADQGMEFVRRLAATLSDETNYTPNDVKCFDPGVAFRIWRREESAEIVICFMCNNFYFGPPTERAYENAAFANDMRHQLLVLVKEAFPGDKEIQALKE
jgi:hypothetical protein